MVELQRPANEKEANEFIIDENSYQAKARRRNLVDENGNYIDSDNPLPVEIPPCICEENSTTTPLLADATFTGEAVMTNGFGIIYVNVYSDQASATNGLIVEQSTDGTNWDFNDIYTIPATTGKTFSVQPSGRYIRVKYINGDTDQTEFRLQTVMKNTGLDSSHRVQDTLNDDDDGRLRLSVLKLRTAQNNYVSGSATNTGNFKVSLEEFESDISTNSNSQLKTTVYDEAGNPAEVDDSTHTLQTIEYEHHELHYGSHFFICDYDSSIQSSETIEFVITTSNTTKWAHMVLDFASILGASLEIYEGSTNVVGGTTVTPINNNRNSTNTSSLTVIKDPTSITDGTRIAGYLAGANRESGFNSRDREIILKQNTIYLFRFTSLSNSNAISFCGEWYEHTNKN